MVEWLEATATEIVAGEQLAGADHPHNRLVHQALEGHVPAHDELVGRYESMAEGWTAWTDAHAEYYTLPLQVALAHVPCGRVIELSSGTGTGTKVLLDRGFDVIAVEPSPTMVAELRAALHVPVVRATSDRLPFASASLALVVGLNAVADAAELRRVLAPGGRVLWCYSFAEATPLYIAPEDLATAVGATRTIAQRVGVGLWIMLEVDR